MSISVAYNPFAMAMTEFADQPLFLPPIRFSKEWFDAQSEKFDKILNWFSATSSIGDYRQTHFLNELLGHIADPLARREVMDRSALEEFLSVIVTKLSNPQFNALCVNPDFHSIIADFHPESTLLLQITSRIENMPVIDQVIVLDTSGLDHSISQIIQQTFSNQLLEHGHTSVYAIYLLNQIEHYLTFDKAVVLQSVFLNCISKLDDQPFCEVCLHPSLNHELLQSPDSWKIFTERLDQFFYKEHLSALRNYIDPVAAKFFDSDSYTAFMRAMDQELAEHDTTSDADTVDG